MKRGLRTFLFFLLVGITVQGLTQTDFKGYVKFMNGNYYAFEQLQTDQLIHNRLELETALNNKWTFRIANRNRLIWGQRYANQPGMLGTFEPENPWRMLEFHGNMNDQALFISNIDRLYISYFGEKDELTIGRQRVNWGINTLWNPHDIFNTYNFLDFDYAERPGSDGIRYMYYFDAGQSIELVGSWKDTSAVDGGVRYKWNKWNYDFQLIGGSFQNDFVTGIGWAGNIKTAGFKGEYAAFTPHELDTTAVHTVSLGMDYTFGSWYVLMGGLYSSQTSSTNSLSLSGASSGQTLSPKQLMPSTYSIMAQGSWSGNPMFSLSGSVIYGFEPEILMILPSVSVSISESWSCSIFAQTFMMEVPFLGREFFPQWVFEVSV